MSGGTRSFEMARRLVQMGHEVNMVTSWRENDGRKDWFVTDEAGIKVHWVPVPYSNKMSYKRRIISFLKFAWTASQKAASLKADVVLATSTPLTISLPGIYAAHRQNIPMVLEIRDLWPEVPISMGVLKNPLLIYAAKILEKFAIKNSTRYVALFERAKTSLIKKGAKEDMIEVIPNGADIELFSKGDGEIIRNNIHCSTKTILIIYTGTFGRVNGVNYIVELASNLKHDERFKFLLIGDGFEKESVVERAKELNVFEINLYFRDRVSKIEIVDYLAAADISISTVIPLKTLEADSANKVFDSLAAGKLVAVNHEGHLKDILEDSGAGLQLSRDYREAARQLQHLADHPERIKHAKHAARKLAVKHYSRDKLAAKLEQVLLRAIEDYKPK